MTKDQKQAAVAIHQHKHQPNMIKRELYEQRKTSTNSNEGYLFFFYSCFVNNYYNLLSLLEMLCLVCVVSLIQIYVTHPSIVNNEHITFHQPMNHFRLIEFLFIYTELFLECLSLLFRFESHIDWKNKHYILYFISILVLHLKTFVPKCNDPSVFFFQFQFDIILRHFKISFGTAKYRSK